MTTQEQLIDLQGQIDELNKKIDSLGKKNEAIGITKYDSYDSFKFYPNLKTGRLIIKYVNQSAEPTPSVNEIMLWKDSDDNKTYIVANFNGTTNHIELV